MRGIVTLLMFLVLGLVAACQVNGGRPSAAEVEEELSVVRPGEAPTPAMLAAAISGDPFQMAGAIGTMAACHGTTTCDASYASCTAWSANINCGSEFCGGVCGPKCPSSDPLCDRPQAVLQPRERYRVCFNGAGAQCTQWQALSALAVSCGCE